MKWFLCKQDHPLPCSTRKKTQFSIWLNNSPHNNVVVDANKSVKRLDYLLICDDINMGERNTLNTVVGVVVVVGICNLPFWKTNFLLRRVTYITYRRKDKTVRTFVDCYWLNGGTTQRSFYSDTFTGRLLLFSVVEFPQFTADWLVLVLVPWIENAAMRYWNWWNFKRRRRGVGEAGRRPMKINRPKRNA